MKHKKDAATHLYLVWMAAISQKLQSAQIMIQQADAQLSKMNPTKADLKIISNAHDQLGNAITKLAESIADHNYNWDDPNWPWNMTEEQLRNIPLAEILHNAIQNLDPNMTITKINMD